MNACPATATKYQQKMGMKSERMSNITHIFMDIDGTLTNGKIYYDSEGRENKAFNIKDGLIISAMGKLGYTFVVVTGRASEIVIKRMTELGVNEIYQEVASKKEFIDNYLKERKIEYENCAYIGDDLNDLCVMNCMGFKGCPGDACEQVKSISDFISAKDGGAGAAREILEKLLECNNDKERFLALYK